MGSRPSWKRARQTAYLVPGLTIRVRDDRVRRDELGLSLRDLEKLAGMARLEAAVSRLSQFSADASHDLRTSITVMLATGRSLEAWAAGRAERENSVDGQRPPDGGEL